VAVKGFILIEPAVPFPAPILSVGLFDENDAIPVALSVVNAPVDAVVAPTVPLILIEAVPVRLVTTPLTGVPRAGVTNVGEVAKTNEPVPVSSVTAASKFALDGVARKVATPVPRPDTPVLMGKPVALVKVPLVGVPRIGVTKVGEVANTKEPVPVSSVIAEAKLALEGVAKRVATPVPKPLTPVEIGRPVAFVKTAALGVPRAGVTRVGLVANTLLPVPVLVTETMFLLASNAKAVEAVKPDSVAVLDADRVVNAPAAAVDVPIGPLNESPTAPV
jgi:hypothetical protein